MFSQVNKSSLHTHTHWNHIHEIIRVTTQNQSRKLKQFKKIELVLLSTNIVDNSLCVITTFLRLFSCCCYIRCLESGLQTAALSTSCPIPGLEFFEHYYKHLTHKTVNCSYSFCTQYSYTHICRRMDPKLLLWFCLWSMGTGLLIPRVLLLFFNCQLFGIL